MKRIRKKLKMFVNFCKHNFKNDLKSILLFGSAVNSPSEAKDIDIIVVLKDNANKDFIENKINNFIKNFISNKSFDLPLTEMKENCLFNPIIAKESEIKSVDLQRMFKKDKILVSFFVPSSLIFMTLKESHKILFGIDETKYWKIEIGFLDYIRTLTRSLSLSLFSILVLPLSVSKSFYISCDSLKHLLQNIFIIETGTVPKKIESAINFYKPSWWIKILMQFRENAPIKKCDKIKFILTLPAIILIMFVEAIL